MTDTFPNHKATFFNFTVSFRYKALQDKQKLQVTTFSELVEACKATFLLDFRLTESWGESKERGLTCQNREGGRGKGKGWKTIAFSQYSWYWFSQYSTQCFSQYSTQLSNFYEPSDSRVIILKPMKEVVEYYVL